MRVVAIPGISGISGGVKIWCVNRVGRWPLVYYSMYSYSPTDRPTTGPLEYMYFIYSCTNKICKRKNTIYTVPV